MWGLTFPDPCSTKSQKNKLFNNDSRLEWQCREGLDVAALLGVVDVHRHAELLAIQSYSRNNTGFCFRIHQRRTKKPPVPRIPIPQMPMRVGTMGNPEEPAGAVTVAGAGVVCEAAGRDKAA